MSTCALVSFRLGLTDGVSIAAASWQRALETIGFATCTIAGEGPVDRVVPGLEIGAQEPPERRALAAALDEADLVVVENLCTIPMNLPAARAVARELRGRSAILHHHDPPWQRERYAHITELPPDDPAWRHVTINELTRRELAARGIAATTIYNGFDAHVGPGERDRTRELLGVGPDELLVGHPVRAIARKGIPEAIALCEATGATYWLAGEAEEDYAPHLAQLLATARCPTIHRGLPHGPDLYAAPDLVAFPSHWEGFGNPPVEAALQSRMTAIGAYPVASELEALGMRWLRADDPEGVRAWLRRPDTGLLARNREVARRHFSLEALTERLHALLGDAGWLP